MAFDAYEVVVVPFPFTERPASKRRPALVLSDGEAFNAAAGQSVLAMITSRGTVSWPLDVPIEDLSAAGLPAPSIVRMKLFTLDHPLILRTAGRLGRADEHNVRASLAQLLRFPASDPKRSRR